MLSPDTTRTLSLYLTDRWKDTEALFPSRSSERIFTAGVQQMLAVVAKETEVSSSLVDGGRGDPGGVTPHALRHPVAWEMMDAQESNT